jgi:hypothetical protein
MCWLRRLAGRHFARMSNDPQSCMILRFGKRPHIGKSRRFPRPCTGSL